jgi:hypothetical protein
MRIRWNWLPWKYVIRRLAKTHGLLDPVRFIAQFNRFAQPAEVAAPMELIRASMVLHARGLLNARTIQTNLDWIWPHWVHRQFNPRDPAFIPRSYTLTHVNLTHRNWTAVGIPDCMAYPIVDPRGLVTPFHDGWSIDAWILAEDDDLLPPLSDSVRQRAALLDNGYAVETFFDTRGKRLASRVEVTLEGNAPVCKIRYVGRSKSPGSLVVSLRPMNPEGVSFIHRIHADLNKSAWRVDETGLVIFSPVWEAHRVSTYAEGDVYDGLIMRDEDTVAECDVGMATAAAVFPLSPNTQRRVDLKIDLTGDPETKTPFPSAEFRSGWKKALEKTCRLSIPDERIQFLYDAAVRAIILHAPKDVYPGPYYYRRFWFRDAALILQTMLTGGLHQRARRVLDTFQERQSMDGYFRSQSGEWDSNGQVLWIIKRYCDLTGNKPKPEWIDMVKKAAKWIDKKRLSDDLDLPHAGLMPAGFSAEHLGNNDYYYWDDFWSIGGLQSAAALLKAAGESEDAVEMGSTATALLTAVEQSLEKTQNRRRRGGIPASPYRRMDAGAVGSLCAGYPLRIWPADDPRLTATVDFLLDRCFIDNAFFLDITHSGYNPYLTLHCAQVLLRAGDMRFLPIMERVAALASSTGQWPEAVHPKTFGGCQGDGQHIWAAAEWAMMIYHLFVWEEPDHLLLGRGIPPKWLSTETPLEIGPVHTGFGPITLSITPKPNQIEVAWKGEWRTEPPGITVSLPGTEPVIPPPLENAVTVPRSTAKDRKK